MLKIIRENFEANILEIVAMRLFSARNFLISVNFEIHYSGPDKKANLNFSVFCVTNVPKHIIQNNSWSFGHPDFGLYTLKHHLGTIPLYGKRSYNNFTIAKLKT